MEEKKEEEVFVFIEGSHIDLVVGHAKWADLICKWINTPEVRHYSRNPWPRSLDDVKKWFEPPSKGDAIKRDIVFIIYHKEDRKPIGTVGLEDINWINKNANIFAYIGYPEYWGKGIVIEAAKLVIKYGFEELNLHKIYSGVFKPNERSLRAIEKLGFSKETTYISDMYVDGKYVDVHKFYLLKDDWIKQNEAT